MTHSFLPDFITCPVCQDDLDAARSIAGEQSPDWLEHGFCSLECFKKSRKPRKTLTAERARKLLHYDGENLRWNVKRQKIQKGSVAGSPRDGYRRVCIDGKRYEAHRLIWLIVYGVFPTHCIDHIDGNPRNNRIENLRDVTHAENCRNQKLHATNTSGNAGVSWDKSKNRWRAEIVSNGKHIKLGTFINKDDAIKARKSAELQHDFHQNHGKPQPTETPQAASEPLTTPDRSDTTSHQKSHASTILQPCDSTP